MSELAAPRRDLATLGAIAIWAAATAAALVFVLILGQNVPFWDEWEIVPYATGDAPVTLGYLWSLHNEHRLVLPRLVDLALLWATAGDFRAGMIANVVFLSGAALLLMRAARRARGSASLADGAFPLLLLHPGHAENLITSFQLQMVLSTTLVCVVLATVAELGTGLRRSQALRIGVPLLLLPLCGANGLVTVPVLGSWLAWRAWRERRSDALGSARLLAFAAGALALTGLYFRGYHGNPAHPGYAGIRRTLAATLDFVRGAFGPAAGEWPVALTLAGLGATAVLVGAWWWRRPADRDAAEGFLATFVALAALALAVGLGRSGFGPGAARAPRYALLAAPLLCWAYLAWCRLPRPGSGQLARLALLALGLAAYPGNLAAGTALAKPRFAVLQALTADLLHGMTIEEASRRYHSEIYVRDDIAGRLAMLQRRRFGPFRWDDARGAMSRRFPFITAPLIDTRDGFVPLSEARVEGRRVILAHAEAQLTFDAPPGRRQATARFGLLPESLAAIAAPGAPHYDGTYFTVTFRSDGGEESELFARLLDPLRHPQDGVVQQFTVPLPGEGGRVVLDTRFGPPGSQANAFGDWGYWTDVEIR